MRGFIMTCYILLSAVMVSAQHRIDVSVSKDSIQIGDQVDITWTVTPDDGYELKSLDFSELNKVENLAYFVDTTFLEETTSIEIISSKNGLSNAHLIIDVPEDNIIKARVSIYDIGAYEIPIPIALPDVIDNVDSDKPVIIQVNPPEGMAAMDSIDIQPIKDIYRETRSNRNWLAWMVCTFFIVVLAALWYLYNKRVTVEEEVEEEVEEIVVIPAHEKAVSALQKMERKELWQHGQEKEYHYELTSIMRRYLEDRYHFPAAEMTTSQLINELKKQRLTAAQKDKLSEILNISDIVKFAKGEAGQEINTRFLQDAYRFIDETKEVISG